MKLEREATVRGFDLGRIGALVDAERRVWIKGSGGTVGEERLLQQKGLGARNNYEKQRAERRLPPRLSARILEL